jgi:hypothetical protein
MFSIIFAMCVVPVFSQKNKPVATPKIPPVPKGPPPYVLKKDYEPQMEELKAKVAAANNATAAVRNSLDNKFERVILLDSQMTQVQEILNSASFQISMNADSLKETRFSMEEFQKKTDANFSIIQSSQNAFSQKVWMLFSAAMAFTVVVLVVVLIMLNKRISFIQNVLNKNEEVIKKSLSIQLDKLQKELKDEMQSAESRTLSDVSAIKREITHQMNADKIANAASINEISGRLAFIENPTSSEDNVTSNNEDPEIFI